MKTKDTTDKATVRDYIRLTKPGIIRGNLITALAAYAFASAGVFDFKILFGVFFGVALVIGGACALNNRIDKDIDAKMDRTKDRAVVVGKIAPNNATIFGVILLFAGGLVLYATTNMLTLLLGGLAAFWYVVIYGYAKRHSVHGTLVGTVPGALPIVAGYTAVTGQLNAAALLLFITMVVWQMPHFYAIGIYRLPDYAAAKLPILSVEKGIAYTKNAIVAYLILFLSVSPLLGILGYASLAYVIVMVALSLVWLKVGIAGLIKPQADAEKWAKKVFGVSLVVLLLYSCVLALDMVLA